LAPLAAPARAFSEEMRLLGPGLPVALARFFAAMVHLCNAREYDFAVSKLAVVGFRYSRPRVANLPVASIRSLAAYPSRHESFTVFGNLRAGASFEMHPHCMPQIALEYALAN
jgi:hypothetical protein